MNLITLTDYVNQDVDDTFTTEQIVLWFNKGIAQYNLIPPLTTYPSVIGNLAPLNQGVRNSSALDTYLDDNYPYNATAFTDTFMLGIMLPYLVSSVKLQEASVSERQIALQEFLQNARMFKASTNVKVVDMLNQKNADLEAFELGENVYISDMRRSPVGSNWQKATVYTEIVNDEDE